MHTRSQTARSGVEARTGPFVGHTRCVRHTVRVAGTEGRPAETALDEFVADAPSPSNTPWPDQKGYEDGSGPRVQALLVRGEQVRQVGDLALADNGYPESVLVPAYLVYRFGEGAPDPLWSRVVRSGSPELARLATLVWLVAGSATQFKSAPDLNPKSVQAWLGRASGDTRTTRRLIADYRSAHNQSMEDIRAWLSTEPEAELAWKGADPMRRVPIPSGFWGNGWYLTLPKHALAWCIAGFSQGPALRNAMRGKLFAFSRDINDLDEGRRASGEAALRDSTTALVERLLDQQWGRRFVFGCPEVPLREGEHLLALFRGRIKDRPVACAVTRRRILLWMTEAPQPKSVPTWGGKPSSLRKEKVREVVVRRDPRNHGVCDVTVHLRDRKHLRVAEVVTSTVAEGDRGWWTRDMRST